MTKYVPQFKLRNREHDIVCEEMEAFLRSINSPLLGLSYFIKDCADYFKINEIFILALCAHESNWGKSAIAKVKNNLCGWGAIDADPMGGAWNFFSREGCIMTVCGFLNRNYLTRGAKYYKGGTVRTVGSIYASDPKWADKICKIMNQIGDWIHEHK